MIPVEISPRYPNAGPEHIIYAAAWPDNVGGPLRSDADEIKAIYKMAKAGLPYLYDGQFWTITLIQPDKRDGVESVEVFGLPIGKGTEEMLRAFFDRHNLPDDAEKSE